MNIKLSGFVIQHKYTQVTTSFMHNSQRTIKMVKMAFFLIKITIHSSLHAEVKAEEKSIIKYLIYQQRDSSQIYVFALVVVHFHETSLRSSSNTIRRVSSTGLHADAIVEKKKSISRANFFPENPPKFLWRQLEIRLRIKKWDLTNHNNLYEGSPDFRYGNGQNLRIRTLLAKL